MTRVSIATVGSITSASIRDTVDVVTPARAANAVHDRSAVVRACLTRSEAELICLAYMQHSDSVHSDDHVTGVVIARNDGPGLAATADEARDFAFGILALLHEDQV